MNVFAFRKELVAEYERFSRSFISILQRGYDEGNQLVTFARYTGQETNEERERIAKNPPDILLTNYVMLELLMTRFVETDKAVRQHAAGLRFLVLDELHTYRGRQGADVAMLIRRVRERFNEHLLCIGTSATMASEGSTKERNAIVANIASRLFGVPVSADNIITETLEPVTNDDTPIDSASLRQAIETGVAASATHAELSSHPVAAWVERKLGLEEQDGKLVRIARPRTVIEAATLLAQDSGLPEQFCQEYLVKFLIAAYQSQSDSGRNFFSFRLHQFISSPSNAYSTIEAPRDRFITLEGQQFKPGDRNRLLFNLSFCRQCGQEYFPVWATMEAKSPTAFSPRELSERSNEEEETLYGYLMPDSEGTFDPTDIEGHYPEDWLEFHHGEPRLKSYYKRYGPIPVCMDTLGKIADNGLPAWFIPGSFRFCLNADCDAYYDGSKRSDLSKLAGLSSEGRSSATTMLALSALRHLIGTSLDANTKKLLAFTDNRQDASLQAGHFNDFIQTLLLRGALLAAIQKDGQLADDILTQRVLDHLHLEPTDYAANPETKGIRAQNTLKTLRDVLGYRLYFDLKRGWRINNPNLDQLGLLDLRYRDLETCCEDEEEWQQGHPLLGAIEPKRRFEIVHKLLDQMRKALCIKTIYLDPNFQEQTRNRSFNELKEPWGLSEDERLSSHFKPVVFCRYIATAHYLGENLRRALPAEKTCVAAITGELTSEQREEQVEALGAVGEDIVPVLVATDCLSEGVNLQRHFNAVVHYDLTWNPTRHEQREGRADRFGQASPTVRTLMLYGEDNPVDGAVLRVILRKAEKIRTELGVAVPLPTDNNKVVDAIMQAVLLQGVGSFRTAQVSLDFGETEAEVDQAWETAQRQITRTVFAQRRLRPGDVLPEWRKAVSVLGGPDDVARFVCLAAERLGAPLDQRNGYSRLPVAHLPKPLQDRLEALGFKAAARLAFAQPAPTGATYIHRAHPLVAALADYVAEQALDAGQPDLGARASAMFTRAIRTRTVLYLLRLRSQLQVEQRRDDGRYAPLKSLLTEECLGVAVRGSNSPQLVPEEDALSLLSLEPGRNMEDGQKTRLIGQALDAIPTLEDIFTRLAHERARELLADHRRIREASDARGLRYDVIPALPVDKIGVYVFVPVASL